MEYSGSDIGILCSSLPTLKGLVSHVFPKSFTSHQRSAISGAKYGSRNRKELGGLSDNDFGNQLSGNPRAIQRSEIGRGRQSSDDMEMAGLASSHKNIHVVTMVQQEVERNQDEARSEHGSTRNLVFR